MKKVALMFAIVPLMMFGLHCQARDGTSPIPEYNVKRVTGKVVVDGSLNESVWQKANIIELQFPWDQQTGQRQPTKVRLLWDEEYLYVAYECVDDNVVSRYMHHDDPVYEDDAVEIFINPNPKMNNYIGLEMNSRGVLYDYLKTISSGLNKTFDLKGVQLKTEVGQLLQLPNENRKGWVLEMAIPLSNFYDFSAGEVVVGTTWTANLNRWDGIEPDRRLSMWSDSFYKLPNPHNPSRFGKLHFIK